MPGDSLSPGFVTFCSLRTGRSDVARELSETIVYGLKSGISGSEGFRGALLHLSHDESTVVVRADWRDESARSRALDDTPGGRVLTGLPERPGVLAADSFGGVPEAGIAGPDAGREPGVVVVAKRHVGGRRNARALVSLLHESGAWKSGFPGFVSANAYISPDGGTYVNYPRWVDESAYRAYMADPRNSAGQKKVARLEVAEPEFVLCTPREFVGPDASTA